MASSVESEPDFTLRLNPIARVILQGVYDDESLLSLFRGIPHILQIIWKNITSYWKLHIKSSRPIAVVIAGNFEIDNEIGFTSIWQTEDEYTKRKPFCSAKFPKPTNLNINMMPFIMETSFKECFLPKYLRFYYEELIRPCYMYTESQEDQIGKIGYLTIHESYVTEHASQRRPGIHTETPGIVYLNDNTIEYGENNINDVGTKNWKEIIKKGSGTTSTRLPYPVRWGFGVRHVNDVKGGIYMASTVQNSCALWDCQILSDDHGGEIIGELGDIEHLREFLPQKEYMTKNLIYWLTDRTPHESLPLKEGTYRQFFRLVMSDVSIWHKDHSTKNPFGVVPDPKITKIVVGSKFDKNGVTIVKDESNDSGVPKENWPRLRKIFLKFGAKNKPE